MEKSTLVRTGIAGAVAAVGLTAGGVAMASADDRAPDAAGAAGPHGGPRGDHGQDAEVIAKALGLKEATVQKALRAVRDDLRPDRPTTTEGTRPQPPTAAERTAREAAFVTALAEKLDVSKAKVEDALAVVRKQVDADRKAQRTQFRAELVKRLDAAVEAGTLSGADRTSVLKAYDAEIIGGGPGGMGGHGGPPAPGTPGS